MEQNKQYREKIDNKVIQVEREIDRESKLTQ